MTPEDANEYIGLPYKEGSFGPSDYNCWGLLYSVQQKHFNVEMPIAPLGDEQACLEMFSAMLSSGAWTQLDFPEHGCGALMRGGSDPHVGVYLDFDGGGILHALEGVGVVWTKLQHLRRLHFGRTTYYRLNK